MEGFLLFYFFVFLFGTTIGSFLNVLIDRIPRNESVIVSRSHCEHCRHILAWYDLIPLISYVLLKGKCRYCHKHIGYYYPIVEIFTGILFVVTANFLLSDFRIIAGFDMISFTLSGYFYLLISCIIVIIFTDIKYGIIPFKIIAVIVIAALIHAILSPFFINYILTALGAFGLFLFLFLITRGRGLGFGDVVYAFMMGLVLGFPKIIVGLYIAFLTGAIISLLLVWSGKKKMKGDSIPFGPFLAAGTILGLFWGEYLIAQAMLYLI